ncbi:GAF domain-containing protein [Fortiea sp. LEGE XX443]|uniref:ATP-binding protein n=1 Tax=Fortiea sp. LEGE XX443 TaxID=1828611 RepID=UPI0018823FF5|nr:GAF domain-containing protein [Fortiea sp. LEGE XX443]
MNTKDNNIAFQVDLTNCDKEPIHIPGSIQPHGIILALQEPELTIVQISCNTLDILGIPHTQLLNQPLTKIFDDEQVDLLKNSFNQEELQFINPLELTIKVGLNNLDFDGIIHRANGVFVLELEPNLLPKTSSYFKFYHVVKQSMSKLQTANTVIELSQMLAKEVKKITGFDRVMVYRFDENWHGAVIAEEKPESLTSYLGLHYPASDIPQQARKLYIQNWLRLVPNSNYQPAVIVPANNPVTQQPLDLSGSTLRSVSSLHIEYMHNMGVTASMSITLMKNQKLWGLISCHHQSPKYVPYEIRNACEFLGQMTSIELGNKEDSEDTEYKIQLKSILSKLVQYMSLEKNFVDGLINYQPNLLNLVNAQGAAVCFAGEFFTLGNTPKKRYLQNLVEWINQNLHEEIFYTDSLSQVYAEAEEFRDVASGLIMLRFSKTQKNYVLWFRPEVIYTVNWGGNPHKPVEITTNGSLRLSPRKSFELWKERVQLKSLPWKTCEVNAARELRSAIVDVVLRKVDELAQLNIELERSNNELDAFAYIASHDLKEPLRGIHNYSNFLIEDYGETLNEEGKAKLKTLIRLTQRMEDLIDSLLHFSRLGRVDLSMQQTDINLVVERSLDLLSARIEDMGVEIRIPRLLPTVYCDRIQVGEVFNNLIANAIKYNEKDQKWIEIGYLEHPNQPVIFYVQDNGIGILDKHFDSIFRIFKRLHGPSKYGGGTGAGLTITKKIVERHGGKIWVESKYGEGTTFYFTLQGVD